MILYVIFDKFIYLFATYWLTLTLVGSLACIIPTLYIICFTDKSVVKTTKYLVSLMLLLVAATLFCIKVNLDFVNSIKTVSYRVEDYRIKNYKDKMCYFLKTNVGTKVVAKDSIELEENDKPANKKYSVGTVITYKQSVLENNVPKYRQKLLQSMLETSGKEAKDKGLQIPSKDITKNKLVRTNYR